MPARVHGLVRLHLAVQSSGMRLIFLVSKTCARDDRFKIYNIICTIKAFVYQYIRSISSKTPFCQTNPSWPKVSSARALTQISGGIPIKISEEVFLKKSSWSKQAVFFFFFNCKYIDRYLSPHAPAPCTDCIAIARPSSSTR
jgi:hypothetical protein